MDLMILSMRLINIRTDGGRVQHISDELLLDVLSTGEF
jgi:hypothetical protein